MRLPSLARSLWELRPPGLRNDHKAVMKLMEEKLYKIHAEARLRRGVESEGVVRGGEGRRLPETFARVSQVTENSPAATAVSQQFSWSPGNGGESVCRE